MKRLWIVTEVFYPDETATSYILTNIATALSEKYDVHVICGMKGSREPTVLCLGSGITVHRTHWIDLNKNRISMRTLRFILISILLSAKLLVKARRSDKVFVTTNPAPLVVFVAFLKRLRGFHLTLLVHDIFPENVVPAGIIKSERSVFFRFQRWLFDRAYARADRIIAIGRDMQEMIQKKIARRKSGAEVCVISNWADTDLVVPSPMPQADRLEIQYSGNLGRVQGLMAFLELFREAGNDALQLSLWGGGAMEPAIREAVGQTHDAHVSLNGPFTREQQNALLGQADLCLITLADGMYGLGVPSKSYNIMAGGRPILYIGPRDSEIWRVVSGYGIGYCFEPSDRQGIVAFLRSLSHDARTSLGQMGREARRLAEGHYDKDIILQQFVNII